MGAGREPLDIHALVREAYRRFDCAPGDVGVCTACNVCMPPEMARKMLSMPVPEIPLDWLHTWFGSAIAFEIGYQRNHPVRWLLPRVMDLLTEGQDVDDFQCDMALNRLRYAGFPEAWEPADAKLVRDFCVALCRYRVGRAAWDGLVPTLDDYLCMAARATIDLHPILRELESCDTADLVLALHPDRFSPKVLWTTFWEDDPADDLDLSEAREAVRAWYASEAMTERFLDFASGAAGTAELRRRAEVLAEDTLSR